MFCDNICRHKLTLLWNECFVRIFAGIRFFNLMNDFMTFHILVDMCFVTIFARIKLSKWFHDFSNSCLLNVFQNICRNKFFQSYEYFHDFPYSCWYAVCSMQLTHFSCNEFETLRLNNCLEYLVNIVLVASK